MQQVRDILVETSRPETLDQTMQQFGAVVVGGGTPGGFVRVDGAYVVRCFSNADFIKFAIGNQGYGKVVREFDGLYNAVSDADCTTCLHLPIAPEGWHCASHEEPPVGACGDWKGAG